MNKSFKHFKNKYNLVLILHIVIDLNIFNRPNYYVDSQTNIIYLVFDHGKVQKTILFY